MNTTGLMTISHILKWHHDRPQRSWGKVIFSQASAILSTGRCLLRRVPAPGGVLLGGVPVLGCWSASGGGAQDGYCCGRYASYWNAFLFIRECNTQSLAQNKTSTSINRTRISWKFQSWQWPYLCLLLCTIDHLSILIVLRIFYDLCQWFMPIIAGNIDIYATEILLHQSGLAVSRMCELFLLKYANYWVHCSIWEAPQCLECGSKLLQINV